MIRVTTLLAMLAAADIAALDTDAPAHRAGEQVRTQSLLTQIENSLAATARQLDVESAQRQTRVHTDTSQLLRELAPTAPDYRPETSLLPGSRSGVEQKLRTGAQAIRYRETIRMRRNALINSFPDK